MSRPANWEIDITRFNNRCATNIASPLDVFRRIATDYFQLEERNSDSVDPVHLRALLSATSIQLVLAGCDTLPSDQRSLPKLQKACKTWGIDPKLCTFILNASSHGRRFFTALQRLSCVCDNWDETLFTIRGIARTRQNAPQVDRGVSKGPGFVTNDIEKAIEAIRLRSATAATAPASSQPPSFSSSPEPEPALPRESTSYPPRPAIPPTTILPVPLAHSSPATSTHNITPEKDVTELDKHPESPLGLPPLDDDDSYHFDGGGGASSEDESSPELERDHGKPNPLIDSLIEDQPDISLAPSLASPLATDLPLPGPSIAKGPASDSFSASQAVSTAARQHIPETNAMMPNPHKHGMPEVGDAVHVEVLSPPQPMPMVEPQGPGIEKGTTSPLAMPVVLVSSSSPEKENGTQVSAQPSAPFAPLSSLGHVAVRRKRQRSPESELETKDSPKRSHHDPHHSLLPATWVRGRVISSFFLALRQLLPASLIVLDSESDKLQGPCRSLATRARRVLDRSPENFTIILPVTNQTHWSLAIARPGMIEIFDSSTTRSADLKPLETEARARIDCLLRILESGSGADTPAARRLRLAPGWQRIDRHSILQTNSDDCGVAVMIHTLYSLTGVALPRSTDWILWRRVFAALLATPMDENGNQEDSIGAPCPHDVLEQLRKHHSQRFCLPSGAEAFHITNGELHLSQFERTSISEAESVLATLKSRSQALEEAIEKAQSRAGITRQSVSDVFLITEKLDYISRSERQCFMDGKGWSEGTTVAAEKLRELLPSIEDEEAAASIQHRINKLEAEHHALRCDKLIKAVQQELELVREAL